MENLQFELYASGDQAVIVRFSKRIEPQAAERARAAAARLCALQQADAGVLEIVPAFSSVAVYYDPIIYGYSAICALVHDTLSNMLRADGTVARMRAEEAVGAHVEARLVEVPVCYGGKYGPDLPEVAKYAGLSEAEAAELHAAAAYTVYAVGFTPGFPYIGGVPERIAMPRRATPRPRVPAGSVGIAAGQTGIYPSATPGGWRLIGRTPLRLFDPQAAEPCLLQPGDRVRFVAIDERQLAEWGREDG